MSNSRISYSPTNPERVNPQFIGIGQKYSRHKKNRVNSDKKKKNVESNYHYMLNLNQQMDNNLQDKKKELLRLQKIRERHNNDVRHKMQEEERKRRELEQLKRKSTQQRTSLKNGLKNAYDMVKTERQNSKMMVKGSLNQYSVELKEKRKQQLSQNYFKHNTISMGKKIGNQRVNKFYRNKNQQSINHYLAMINDEEEKYKSNQFMIKEMSSTIKKCKKEVSTKQQKLKNIMDQMSYYSVQSQTERKANLLATGDLFRSIKTSSTQRSRPSQILKGSLAKPKKINDF